ISLDAKLAKATTESVIMFFTITSYSLLDVIFLKALGEKRELSKVRAYMFRWKGIGGWLFRRVLFVPLNRAIDGNPRRARNCDPCSIGGGKNSPSLMKDIICSIGTNPCP